MMLHREKITAFSREDGVMRNNLFARNVICSGKKWEQSSLIM